MDCFRLLDCGGAPPLIGSAALGGSSFRSFVDAAFQHLDRPYNPLLFLKGEIHGICHDGNLPQGGQDELRNLFIIRTIENGKFAVRNKIIHVSPHFALPRGIIPFNEKDLCRRVEYSEEVFPYNQAMVALACNALPLLYYLP
jgi:hypothetical protein